MSSMQQTARPGGAIVSTMTFLASHHLRRRAGVSLALSAAAFGLATAPADAAVTRTSIAGPSADLALASVQKVDVDVAPDGSAAIAYRQKVGGVDHVFVARYVNGAWGPAQRVDSALATPSTQPAVAVGSGGKTLVVFPNGTAGNERLYAAYAPDGAAAFGAKLDVQLDPAGWKEPDLDLAPNGNGYFTVYEGFHLRAYRVEGTTFTPVGDGFPGLIGILNGVTTEQAEAGDQRGAHLAVDATGGSATFAWSETNGVAGYTTWARKVTGTDRGTAVNATIPTLDGKPAANGANDMTHVSIGGDGRAWVAFREAFTYPIGGGMTSDRGRALVRSFDGATFGAAAVIDGLGANPNEGAEYPRLATNASGAGLATNYRQLYFGTDGASLPAGGTWTTGTSIGYAANASAGRATVALGDSGVGVTAMVAHPPSGKEISGLISGGPANGTREVLSDPAYGLPGTPYEAGAGGGYAITAFQQGTAATSRIVAAVVALPEPPKPAEPGNGTSGGGTVTPAPAPVLSALKFRTKSLTATSAAPKLVTAKTKTRTLSFSLDRAASVDLTVVRTKTGKRSKGKCTPVKGKTVRKKDRCVLETPVKGKATLLAPAGTSHLKFGGRVTAGKRLAPGTYALYAVARDGSGASKAVRAPFTLKSGR